MYSALRKFPVKGIALSFVLALVPFCVRSDNALLAPFELHGATPLFVAAIITAILLACVCLLKISSFSCTPILDSACIGVFGIALLLTYLVSIEIVPVVVAALGTGCLLGLGLTYALYRGLGFLLSTSPIKIAENLCVALLLAAFFSYVIMFQRDTGVVCLALFSCSTIGMTALSVIGRNASKVVSPTENNEVDFPLVPLTNTKRVVSFAWGGIAGIAFNIFTLGLTFWPESAGLYSGEPTSTKVVAYAIVSIIVLATTVIVRRSVDEGYLELFYRIALPVGIAIVLASPFLENIVSLNDIPVLSNISFLGIALLNTLGLIVVVWVGASSRTPFAKIYASMMASCGVALAAGVGTFQLLGHQAQIISLCVLTLFFMLLVLTTVRDNMDRQKTQHRVPRDLVTSVCKDLADEYALSPREKEILMFLARGRGSKHIAAELGISPETVRTHSKRIYEKMDIHSKEALLDLIERQD